MLSMSRRRSGCKHRRVWTCEPNLGCLKMSAPDFPGVVIEAKSVIFCEQCSRFRVIGLNGDASPWKYVQGFSTRMPQTPAAVTRKEAAANAGQPYSSNGASGA